MFVPTAQKAYLSGDLSLSRKKASWRETCSKEPVPGRSLQREGIGRIEGEKNADIKVNKVVEARGVLWGMMIQHLSLQTLPPGGGPALSGGRPGGSVLLILYSSAWAFSVPSPLWIPHILALGVQFRCPTRSTPGTIRPGTNPDKRLFAIHCQATTLSGDTTARCLDQRILLVYRNGML